ncbi:MAG: adenine phosphoribosyltransferase [Ruminococcaceae bacterium]|nr:adenine phosphoribosyltransferase [Oscillospiraceae bacterium]
MMIYKLKVAGVERDLTLCPISERLMIAGFVMLGDTELTEACAEALCPMLPAHDVLITAEAKGIPLICAMARRLGEDRYIVARKKPKLYMKELLKCEVSSITTEGSQCLYLDGSDAELMRGKRVVIVDDVISTGQSLHALEELVKMAGGQIVAKVAVLAEGKAIERDDIRYLAPLPLFDSEGNPL